MAPGVGYRAGGLQEEHVARRPDDNEVDQGNFRTAGVAVGGLGTFGVVVGLVMYATGAGDPRMVEMSGMFGTGLMMAVIGSVMYWWGARQ